MVRPTEEERFWTKVDKSGDCWEWTASRDRDGYGKFGARAGYSSRAHRYSYSLDRRVHISEVPQVVRHTCDNPGCVNPAHLRGGTFRDNTQDMVGRGRSSVGERHGMSKLTEEDVSYIRLNPFHLSQSQLATLAGVAQSTISKITRRVRWAHV